MTRINTLILIPARSGSKGILNKNIKLLGEKPLFCWSADAVKNANLGDDVLTILSTDSEKYADIAKQHDILVPFIRPAKFAVDHTTAMEVIIHALIWFAEEYGYKPRNLMWLQPTSPFRGSKTIIDAMQLINQADVYAVVGCKQLHTDESLLFHADNRYIKPIVDDIKIQNRRQEIDPLLTPNGAMYLIKTEHMQEVKSFYYPKAVPLIMDKISSIDLDEDEDWEIANAYLKAGLVQSG